jgi:uncharacterized membrane protein
MLANHYPLAFATRWNWLIAAIVLVIGAVVRYFFNEEHAGRKPPWWTWAVAALGFLLIIWLSAAGPAGQASAAAAPVATPIVKVSLDDAQAIVTAHCSMCHAKEPGWPGVNVAPKGVLLETPDEIRAHARQIGLQAVWSHAMPPGGNITEISDEERATLALWLDQGASGG